MIDAHITSDVIHFKWGLMNWIPRLATACARRCKGNKAHRNSSCFHARDWRSHILLACLSFVLVSLPGCGNLATGLPVVYPGDTPVPPGDPAYQTAVQIRYLGAGGVLIKRGDDV